MSTHVIGFKPPDEKWKQMKEIFDACKKANIALPTEVDKFFNHEEPDDAGVRVDLKSILEKYTDDGVSGYQLDLSKLPNDVKIIRFVNSW